MSVEHILSGLQHGDEASFNFPEGQFHVAYESEPAIGDNGRPAEGFVKGHYVVRGGQQPRLFAHSPHGPGLMGAKSYAASQAANYIGNEVTRRFTAGRQRSDYSPDTGHGMLISELFTDRRPGPKRPSRHIDRVMGLGD